MWTQTCRNFLTGAITLAIFSGLAFATNHHELNGTWQLVPARSEFHGEPAIQTGTVTINDREGNIYVQRNFNFDGAKQSTSTSFAPTHAPKPLSRSRASRARRSGRATC